MGSKHRGAPRRAGLLTPWLAGGALLGAAMASCGYPEFGFVSAAAGSAAISGSGSGADAGSATGGEPAIGGEGGMSSSDGTGGSGGESAPLCGERAPAAPATCFNGVHDDDEVGPDCGGGCQPCFEGSCQADGDCLNGPCAGTCPTPFRVEYQCGDPNRTSLSPRFQAKLWNDTGGSTPLAHLNLRYYFRRNGAAEPLHVRSGQAILYQGAVPLNVTGDTTWSVVRVNADELDDFDAYIEIGFSAAQALQPGDRVELYQELWGGNDATSFDQSTHYSFDDAAFPFVNYGGVTLFDQGQLVWGFEPRRGGTESCFARGVNLNGNAVTIRSNAWESGTAALTLATGSAFSGAPADVWPPVQGALAQLLSTGYRLVVDESVSLPVESGDYLVYVYAVSQTGEEVGTFMIEDSLELDAFQAGVVNGAPGWAKLGPYPVTVSDGAFDLSCLTGAVRVTGIELRTPNSALF